MGERGTVGVDRRIYEKTEMPDLVIRYRLLRRREGTEKRDVPQMT